MWQDEFTEIDTPSGAQMVNSRDDLIDIFNVPENIEHQALLRKKASAPENPSITDDFDCVFLQGNPDDTDSNECIQEKGNLPDCQYWQTCDFKAVKGKDCEVIASRVVALVIPIVILLLTTAIFAIYCFKKKGDEAKKKTDEINDRLPGFGPQDSSRSNGRGEPTISSISKSGENGSIRTSVYNGTTPGLRLTHDYGL